MMIPRPFGSKRWGKARSSALEEGQAARRGQRHATLQVDHRPSVLMTSPGACWAHGQTMDSGENRNKTYPILGGPPRSGILARTLWLFSASSVSTVADEAGAIVHMHASSLAHASQIGMLPTVLVRPVHVRSMCHKAYDAFAVEAEHFQRRDAIQRTSRTLFT